MKSYLKLHPLNPNILLALFGNVALWDLNTGKKIFEDFDKVIKFESINYINHKYLITLYFKQGKLQLHSCWSQNQGERFVAIDCAGHLSIYGFGEIHDENLSKKTQINEEYLVEPLANEYLRDYKSSFKFKF